MNKKKLGNPAIRKNGFVFSGIVKHKMVCKIGYVMVAYIVNKKEMDPKYLDGQLKIVTDIFTAEMERMDYVADKIADWLVKHYDPKGAMVVICDTLIPDLIVSAVRKEMMTDPDTKMEALAL